MIHDAPRDAGPADRDIDLDVDVMFEEATSDPDADAAALRQCERTSAPVFRTPVPGVHLDGAALRQDIDPTPALLPAPDPRPLDA